MPAAFHLNQVTHRFGELTAVSDLSIEVGEKEQVALIGPSGSGKTTLIRLINTMLIPDEGEIRIFGDPVRDFGAGQLRKIRTRIATIPQHLGLVPNLSVLQNVILGRGGKRSLPGSIRDLLIPPKDEVELIHGILDRVGIEEKLYQRTSSLSGGQQQRVAIARALYQRPDVLLADEPVSSVDPARARDTVGLLTELSGEEGFTLCVSLHHLELAREFFPRLVGLRNGAVMFDGAPGELNEGDLTELFHLSNGEMIEDA